MKKLILVFHPNYDESVHIKGAINEIEQKGKNTDVVIVDKDGKWDVDVEQDRLLKYDVITFAFPIWWYTAPWTYYKYTADVFTAGFSFGFKSIDQFKLKDKKFATLVSVGSNQNLFSEKGVNRHTIESLNNQIFNLMHLATSTWPITGKPISDDKFMVAKIWMFGSAMSKDNNWSKAADEYLEKVDAL